MSDIRTIYLEIVRSGPSHNQLLSPLTHYLALCGNFPAAEVSVPQEHGHFMRRLQDLQHTGTEGWEQHRRSSLDELGQEIAQLLAQVPGLAIGLSAAQKDQVMLAHLQLVISAAELALLPFELSAVPYGCPGGEKNRLLLQNEVPLCITRQVRGISRNSSSWPRKPRILFVAAAPGGREIPLEAHTQALLAAILPWVQIDPEKGKADSGIHEAVADMLTIVPDATLYDITKLCQKNTYTHVHVLAHGEEDTRSEGRTIGLALSDSRGGTDIVTGDRFATALKTACTTEAGERACLPSVVTLATCHGAQVRDIVYSGASFAHELHQAGIALVVASQFPLTSEGSVHMAKMLYRELLWGADPRIAIHTLRRELYALHSADRHDWASLVAYTALPDDLESELEHVQYEQARRAISAALGQIDTRADEEMSEGSASAVVTPDPNDPAGQPKAAIHTIEARKKAVEDGLRKVDEAARHLPTKGIYSTEGNGLIGATEKRKAECWFLFARSVGQTERHYTEALTRCDKALHASRDAYKKAIQGSLETSKETPQIKTSRHWVLVQYLSLNAVLGKDLLEDYWYAARVSAETDLSSDIKTQAEAHSSLTELYLLRLAYPAETSSQETGKSRGPNRGAPGKSSPLAVQDNETNEMAQRAEEHIRTMIVCAASADHPFIIRATYRQFKRYSTWWSDPQFEEFLKSRGEAHKKPWRQSDLSDLAIRLAEICRSEF